MFSSEERKGKRFKGIPVNSGKAYARVCLFSTKLHNTESYREANKFTDEDSESGRVDEAVKKAGEKLDAIIQRISKEVGEAEGAIFKAQKMIMNDPEVISSIKKRVSQDKQTAEEAVETVFDEYEKKFRELDNEYLNDRATDMGEIKSRLLSVLGKRSPGFHCAGQANCAYGKNSIIVAKALTADMMVDINLENVHGIVTEKGGMYSHAAVIARSVGLPAVSGVKELYGNIPCGVKLLIDGEKGEVILDPDSDTVHEEIPPYNYDTKQKCMIASPAGTEVLANASILEDVKYAQKVHADGIGLYRTEIFVMRRGYLPGLEEQRAYYRNVHNVMGDKPVTFRLLDVGGDKELPFLNLEKESNPYLGWRGSRFLLGNPDILSTQIKALAGLSKLGRISIMFPMVIDAYQAEALIKAANDILVTEEGVIRENISWGVMFEVPSACMQADKIFDLFDFGSVGSNDLLQYLFAVDRDNEYVSSEYNPDHPVFWDVLSRLSDTAEKKGKYLSICGEIAGRRGMSVKLREHGINNLSVSPRLIPRVRAELSETHLEKEAGEEALPVSGDKR